MPSSMKLDIITILETTLNMVDRRLVDHGKRVAYLTYKALARRGGLADTDVRDICLLATIHDIGAYKTEEIDQMLVFETEKVWEHSIYGYLFVRHFSPLAELAPALLFHHASLAELAHLHPSFHTLAQLIFVADRLDILRQTGTEGADALRAAMLARGDLFDAEVVALVCGADVDWQAQDFGMSTDAAYQAAHSAFNDSYTEDERLALMRMIIFTMEFRSPQTVSHTVASTEIGLTIARLLGLSAVQQEHIYLGSMLHDIGKVGISPAILESPNRFTDAEFALMQSHVSISADILAGQVEPDVVALAARHHERLNGSGYLKGMEAGELTLSERIIAVADVISALAGERTYKAAYPRERVVAILEECRDKGQLDARIVDLSCAHYGEITLAMQRASRPLMETYGRIRSEYAYLREVTAMIAQPGCALGLLTGQALERFLLQ